MVILTRLAVLGLALGLACPLLAESPVRVDELRLGDWDDRIRLVLETDRRADVELRQSGRQVRLEFSGIDPASLRHQLAVSPPQDHILIRAHSFEVGPGNNAILVLDLVSDRTANLFALQPEGDFGHRLVLDLMRPDTTTRPDPSRPAPAEPPREREELDGRVDLRDVRLGDWADRTRLVIETDQPLAFHMPAGSTGRTLIMLLEGLGAGRLAPALAAQVPDDHKLITAARVNGGETGRARLQLDLHRAAKATVFNLEPHDGYGHRLVIDLAAAPEAESTQPDDPPRPEPDEPLDESDAMDSQIDDRAAAEPELMWLEASLNQQDRRLSILALKTGDGLFLNQQDLERWQLRRPDAPHLEYGGEAWYSLDALGIDHDLDPQRLTLDMTAPANLFAHRDVTPSERERIEPTRPPPGAFLNYDISATHSSDGTGAGALLELGAFNRWGTAVSSAVARHGHSDSGNELVRLDTTWRRDNPEQRRSLILGDTLSRGTSWSGGVRFAGIQWGNNFDLHPELVTLPLISMTGEAELPSTVEVYVNDALRLREDIDPGPFDIDRIPVVTGAGQARVVVTDILGRQQIITQDFYASKQLLREGLHDWSWEAGTVRENYGIENLDYGRAFAAATHRYGFSNRLTGEFHAQLSEDHGTAGTGAGVMLPGGGVFDLAAALSRRDGADGWFGRIGLQREGERLSGGIESQFASEDFTRLGMQRSLPEHQWRGYLSLRAPDQGTYSLSYTGQQFRERDDIELITLRHSRRLGSFGHLSLSAIRFMKRGETAVMASFSIPMDKPRTQASLSASVRDDSQSGTLQVSRSLPVGTGNGYDLRVRAGDGALMRGSLAHQNDHGRWELEASHRRSQLATRGRASGGLVWFDGELFASRRVRDSFAVVQVPGFADVRVYADNQQVGRTNQRGSALVPHLRPYQRNRLSIDQADIPLGATVGGLKREFAPYWRSGVLARFPVTRTRDAFFRIELENGDSAPAGAVVMDEDGEEWPVGHRGEAFITDLPELSRLRLRHNGSTCEFELEVPESDEPLLDLGTVTCRETQP